MGRLGFLSLLSLAHCATFTVAVPFHSLAPLNDPGAPAHELVNNSYIVMFKDGVTRDVFDNHINFVQAAHFTNPITGEDAGLRYVYDEPMTGYSGKFSPEVLQLIRAQPEVDYVDYDQIVDAPDAIEEPQGPDAESISESDDDDGDDKDFEDSDLLDFEDELDVTDEWNDDSETDSIDESAFNEDSDADKQYFATQNISGMFVQQGATWVSSIIYLAHSSLA
jgi:hypothetical protein